MLEKVWHRLPAGDPIAISSLSYDTAIPIGIGGRLTTCHRLELVEQAANRLPFRRFDVSLPHLAVVWHVCQWAAVALGACTALTLAQLYEERVVFVEHRGVGRQ